MRSRCSSSAKSAFSAGETGGEDEKLLAVASASMTRDLEDLLARGLHGEGRPHSPTDRTQLKAATTPRRSRSVGPRGDLAREQAWDQRDRVTKERKSNQKTLERHSEEILHVLFCGAHAIPGKLWFDLFNPEINLAFQNHFTSIGLGRGGGAKELSRSTRTYSF